MCFIRVGIIRAACLYKPGVCAVHVLIIFNNNIEIIREKKKTKSAKSLISYSCVKSVWDIRVMLTACELLHTRNNNHVIMGCTLFALFTTKLKFLNPVSGIPV